MVAQKYRWDFVGLSTDEKPTASTSEKVVDGSTYYCADNSKLYVWYGSAWYEKTVSGGGPSVVQTTGTSTTDVMSQNAVTSMVFADPSTKQKVQIGANASVAANNGITIGSGANIHGNGGVAIGLNSVTGDALGQIALGATTGISSARYSQAGVMSIQAGNSLQGYNNTVYRLLEGLYDPQSAHDAATKGYVDSQLVYASGDTITISQDGTYVAGRQKVSGTTKTIECAIPINKPLSSDITNITFTPSGYNEAFGSQGLLFSKNNPTSSALTFDCTKSTDGLALIKVVITAVDSNINLQHNNCCSVHLSGTFTLS